MSMKITPYRYKERISPKQGFGEAILESMQENSKIVVLGSDISKSVGLGNISEKYPKRFISLGIAEQNAAAVAAGMSLEGFIPVMSTYAVFSAMRALDQIRVSLCYNNIPAIIGGAHAGISVGPDGATHQALEDIAAIRGLPNMTLLSPCDYTQAKQLTKLAIKEITGPTYIRYGREAMPDFTLENQELEIGKAQILREGKDISIFATGNMVWESLEAAKLLEKKGVSAEIINIHTLKPLDEDSIIKSAKKCGKALSVEEHQISGGLGSAIAEVLIKKSPIPMDFIGMPNQFGESGEAIELMTKYGMDAKTIFQKALNLMNHE